jgi:hypothetical protein
MQTQQTLPETVDKKNPIAVAIQKAIESKQHRKRSFPEYRSFIQHHYDGIAGKLTSLSGLETNRIRFDRLQAHSRRGLRQRP